ncbi:RES domain-containing protein [Sphingobium sp. YR768]|uniref:RES domain-containing protein n=1 Tax=Sphingobium sp. YR768 TaxID=1884365 RepID=UPI0008C0163E|nr:RES domain-containing protein [Sphingobium sp. YR768]SER90085.1 RES domain-containing protein [Sphingobium sp. YR768]
MADYLAQRMTSAIDGMLYRSTQTGSKGRNIMLFPPAARVEPLDPMIDIEAHASWMEPEDDPDSFSLTVKHRTEAHSKWSNQN